MRNILAFILLLLLAPACSQKPAVNANNTTGNIKIGVFLSLTGATSGYGISALNSFKLATEEINGGGGIAGRHVEPGRKVFTPEC